MKTLAYFGLKYVLRFYNYIYFRSVKVYGKKNLPSDGGILYSPNHQGAFLDPLLIGSITPGKVTSLTRSDVFGGPLQWFLDAFQMLPVYRIRNGYGNLKKNDAIFERCYDLLGEGKNVMMFSEGGHHNEYFLQRLSKGSSRLAFLAQKNHPLRKIYLQPVGINYGHHQQPRCTLHLVFGNPIEVGALIQSDLSDAENINILREELQNRMAACMWLPENDAHYMAKKERINSVTTRKDFFTLKEILQNDWEKMPKRKPPSFLTKFLAFLLFIPSFVPLLISRWIINKFEDIVFISSMKYALGAFFFPIWWFLSGVVLSLLFSPQVALFYIGLSIVSLFYREKLLLY